MLLYALACRHGWGVKRNEYEAVVWLKKAVEVSGLDLAASDTSPAAQIGSYKQTQTPVPNTSHLINNRRGIASLAQRQASKAHQTSLALSIFELGMSYMHGWGVDPDASQALRMFEIAAGLGDVDAMIKTAESYRDGVGCKRNMKKAAEWLRRAEGMGAVIVGESWSRKDKYHTFDESARNGDSDVEKGEVGENKENDRRGRKTARALFALKR